MFSIESRKKMLSIESRQSMSMSEERTLYFIAYYELLRHIKSTNECRKRQMINKLSVNIGRIGCNRNQKQSLYRKIHLQKLCKEDWFQTMKKINGLWGKIYFLI